MKNKVKTLLMTIVLILPLLVNGLGAVVYANTGRDISSTHVTGLQVDQNNVSNGTRVATTLKFDDKKGKISPGDVIKVNWPAKGTAKIVGYMGNHAVMAEGEDGEMVQIGTAVVTADGVTITFESRVDEFEAGSVSGGVVFSFQATNYNEKASSETITITAGSHVVDQTISSPGQSTGEGEHNYPFVYKSGVIRPTASDVVEWDIGLNNMKKEFVIPIVVNDKLVDSPGGHKLLPETINIYVDGNVKESFYGLEGIEKFKTTFGADFDFDAEQGTIYINIPAIKGLSSGTSFRVIYKSKIIDQEAENFENILVVNYQEEGKEPENENIPHSVENINSGAWVEGSNLGKLKIIKTDDSGEKRLANAVFELRDSNGNVVGDPITTDGNGEVMVKRLPIGDYTLIETQAPEGYKLDSTPRAIKIEKNKETKNVTEVIVENEKNEPVAAPKGSLEITKTDSETGNLLAGATFELKNSDNVVIGEPIVTDQHGQATVSELALGDYTLTETLAPTGYELVKESIKFVIKEDATSKNTTALTVKNNKIKGSLAIVKVDKADGTKTLPGATFVLKDSAGNVVVQPIVTDGKGQAVVNGLDLGNYTLTETAAPIGYDRDKTEIKVIIAENVATKNRTTLTIENTKSIPWIPIIPRGSLEIIKTDKADAKKVLAGATFELKDSKGNVIGNPIVTDEKGQAVVKGLDLGDYTLTETAAPKGYDLDKTPIKVTIAENVATKNITTLTVKNTKSIPWIPIIPRGSLEIIKTDKADAKKVLAGATFELKDSKGQVVGKPIVTNDKGQAVVKGLDLGEYTLTETLAPKGYDLDRTPIKVIIAENVATKNRTTLTIENTKSIPWIPIIPRGSLEIIKTDKADAKKVLAGATFELKDSKGNVIGNPIVTDEKGQAVVKGLDLGDYTLTETAAPKGYDLDKTPIKVTIAENVATKNITTLTVKNTKSLPWTPMTPSTPKGSLEITKTDEKTGKVLAGATFELKDSEGKVVGEAIVTDEKGQAIVKGLDLGDYTLTETAAPKGYSLDQTDHVVVIAENKETNNTTKITITNKENLPWTGKPTPETPKEEVVKQPKKESKIAKETKSDKLLPQAGEEINSALLILGLIILATVILVKSRRLQRR